MEKHKIDMLLEQLDVTTIIRDIAQEYTPRGQKKQDNISCVFASDTHATGKDNSKSMTIGIDGQVYCHACGYKATNIIWFFKDFLKCDTFEEAAENLIDKYIEPLVDGLDVRVAHTKLLHSPVMVERLKMLRGLSEKTIKEYKIGLYRDRITIPVLNEYGYFCNIRLYDLLGLQKVKIMSFKEGYGKAKLFPYKAFDKPGDIYIFEGEMDCILARQLGLNAITTTAGAATWKSEWDNYFIKRNVILVPDMDKAGLEGNNKRAKALSAVAKTVSVIKLPVTKEHKDFTDYIIKEKHTIKEFLSLKKESFNKSKIHEIVDEDNVDIKTSVKELTYLENAEYVFGVLSSEGSFFKDQKDELFYITNEGDMYEIRERNQRFLSKLSRLSPLINTTTAGGKFAIQHIKNLGFTIAKEITSGSWTLYHNNSIYLCLNPNSGKILKFTKEGYNVIENGINEDGVLLEYPVMISPLAVSKCTVSEGFDKLKRLVSNNIAMSEEDRFQYITWSIAAFFRNLVSAKPIIRLEASTAAGKSSATRVISSLLYGGDLLQHASTIASTYVLATKYPLLLFDNIETRNMTYEFQDFLLIAATGGSRIKRQLHTDSGFITESSDCLVLTNGIEPYEMNEVISRTIVLNIDNRRYGKQGYNLTKVLNVIEKNRNDILFPILKHLIPYVLKNKDKIQKYSVTFGRHSKDRFNEFYGLIKVILEGIWPYFNIEKSSIDTLMDSWFSKHNKETIEQSIAVNDVVYFFNTYAVKEKTMPDITCRVSEIDGKIMIKGQLIHLLSDFRMLAKAIGVKCPWNSPRHLSARLKDSQKLIERDGWQTTITKTGGRHVYMFKKEKAAFSAEEVNDFTKKRKEGVKIKDRKKEE